MSGDSRGRNPCTPNAPIATARNPATAPTSSKALSTAGMIAYDDMSLFSAIAVLGGTGQQGRGLAQRLAMAGERIIVGSRDAERARAAIARWSSHAAAIDPADNVTAGTRAGLPVLPVPDSSVDALLPELAPA